MEPRGPPQQGGHAAACEVEISQRCRRSVETSSGRQNQPIIGTRTIHDGDPAARRRDQLLAGLDPAQHPGVDSQAGVAGVMDIPGSAACSQERASIENRETEIVMTLTPRIVRIPDITEDDLATLWVGTEEHMQLRGSAQNALGQRPFAELRSDVGLRQAAAGNAERRDVGRGV